jgi:hypothetical protein
VSEERSVSTKDTSTDSAIAKTISNNANMVDTYTFTADDSLDSHACIVDENERTAEAIQRSVSLRSGKSYLFVRIVN